MRVLVIGAGTAGMPTIRHLVARGHDVAILTRRGKPGPEGTESFPGDVATGEGLDRALQGVECTVDCANKTTMGRPAAIEYFVRSTKQITERGARAGVKHHVVLSIVKADSGGYGYLVGKLAQERTALAGPVPASVLRATQFHEFVGQLLGMLHIGSLAFVPRALIQPIAADEVGAALADVVEAGPAGRVPDIAGPRQELLADLAVRWTEVRGPHRRVIPLSIPGRLGRLMREGGQLPGPDAVLRGPTFDEWLRQLVAATSGP